MANIKSAIKRNKQNEQRRLRNRVFRGRARTFVKQAREVMEQGSLENSSTSVLVAISTLDKAAQMGSLHKNNAARRKSRLMRRLAKIGKEKAQA